MLGKATNVSKTVEDIITWILNDNDNIIDKVVCAEDVKLGVLGVGYCILPDGEVEAPACPNHLPPLVDQDPCPLPQLTKLQVELADRLGTIIQSNSLYHEHHCVTSFSFVKKLLLSFLLGANNSRVCTS